MKYIKDILIKENIMEMDYIYLEIKNYNGWKEYGDMVIYKK